MTTCGNSYFSINGIKKCGAMNETNLDNFVVEYAAGESVEFNFKLDNAQGRLGLEIHTGLTH